MELPKIIHDYRGMILKNLKVERKVECPPHIISTRRNRPWYECVCTDCGAKKIVCANDLRIILNRRKSWEGRVIEGRKGRINPPKVFNFGYCTPCNKIEQKKYYEYVYEKRKEEKENMKKLRKEEYLIKTKIKIQKLEEELKKLYDAANRN